MSAAHQRNLIHRDVKPSNVLIDPDGNVKVADFGLARSLVDGEISNAGEICGTPQFMSPEQTMGEKIDHRTDLFSLGAVMYTMCTGHPPFRGDDMLQVFKQVQNTEVAPIEKLRGDMPVHLLDLIKSLLVKSPDQRIQSAQQVLDTLETIENGRVLPKRSIAKVQKQNRQRLLRPLLAIVAGIAFLLGASEVAGWTNFGTMLMDVVRIKTPNGTLIVKVDDPKIEVTVDGAQISISDGDSNVFHFKPGDYKVEARKDGRVVLEKIVSLERDGREVLSIELEPNKPKAAAKTDVATNRRSPNCWRTNYFKRSQAICIECSL